MGGGRKMLGQVLKEMRVAHEGMIQEALVDQRAKGGLIGESLVRLGHVPQSQIQLALAKQAGFEAWDLEASPPDPAAVAKLDQGTATTFTMLPVAIEGNTLVVAMADAANAGVLTDVQFLTNMEVRGVVADAERLKAALAKAYEASAKSPARGGAKPAATEAPGSIRSMGQNAPTDLDKAALDATSAPVIKLLNFILSQ